MSHPRHTITTSNGTSHDGDSDGGEVDSVPGEVGTPLMLGEHQFDVNPGRKKCEVVADRPDRAEVSVISTRCAPGCACVRGKIKKNIRRV
jgi:hypothetical protein